MASSCDRAWRNDPHREDGYRLRSTQLGRPERFVGPKTKFVAIGAASNALGTINDLEAAIKLAHDAGAFVFVDAVHYAPHVLIDVRKLDCDFLGMSAYKFYGPHTGVLYAKRALLEEIDFPKLVPAPDYAPENAETGTQNQEGMVGTAAAIDFLASLELTVMDVVRTWQTVFHEMHAAKLAAARAFVARLEFDFESDALWTNA